uniref:(California timema) hypothetical protein n=1 Tax=Timema californicum TaxID=61474 RepID=A0A7R9IW79_TIMCA|nr:unnamed protein product [Timema californicum]
MAAIDDNTFIHPPKFSSEERLEWVPLSITLVEYPQGDLLGKLLAITSLMPLGIISGFIALILFRRDLHTISFFLGTTINEVLNLILKHTFCEARPIQRNALYTEYGMPSSHSQFMWFFTTYVVYFVFISHDQQGVLAIPHMEAGVEWSLGWVSFWLSLVCTNLPDIYSIIPTHRIMRPTKLMHMQTDLRGMILRFDRRISEFLLLRDTTLIPNVLWFEYTHSRQEARARSRKLVSMKSQ